MDKKYLILVFLLIYSWTNAQELIVDWYKCYGGSESDWASTLIITSDSTAIFYNAENTAWIVKINTISGDTLWSLSPGEKNYNLLKDHEILNDSIILFIGYSYNGEEDMDTWMIKINHYSGEVVWSKFLGEQIYNQTRDIESTHDKGYIITGSIEDIINSTLALRDDVYVVKLDSLFNIEWKRTYGGSAYDGGFYIKQEQDSSFILIGTTSSIDGDIHEKHGDEYVFDIWFVKLDKNGNIEYEICYGGSHVEQMEKVLNTSDNGYLIIGWTLSNDGDIIGYKDHWDALLMKLDSLGSLEWAYAYGGYGGDYINSGLELSNNDYVIIGSTFSGGGDIVNNNGNGDIWIFYVDSLGHIFNSQCIGAYYNDHGYDIKKVSNNNYIICGDISESHCNNGSYFSVTKSNAVVSKLNIYCEPINVYIDTVICEGDSIFFFNEYLSEMGIYSDTVLLEFFCDSITNINVELINCNNGISSNDFSIPSVFPNPTINGQINIQSDNYTKAELFNKHGILVLTTTKKSIDIANQPFGLYYLKVIDNKNTYFIKVIFLR